MLAKIRNYIFTGLLVTLPLLVTVAVLSWIFVKLTNIVLRWLPPALSVHPGWTWAVRLIIPIALLIILAVVGIVAKIVFIRKLFGFGEKLLIKIPLFNKVYIAMKQISQAFLSTEKSVYKRVVLVEYPRKGIHSIGFVTARGKGEVQDKTKGEVLNIFVPTTPNPTSGVLIFVRETDIIELDMTVEEGLKMVISGGTVVPPHYSDR